MKQTNKLLSAASEKLDLPADVLAGQPRIEWVGVGRCSVEPHRGLLEYQREYVSVDTSAGKISITGRDLEIAQMNRERLTVKGTILAVLREELCGE